MVLTRHSIPFPLFFVLLVVAVLAVWILGPLVQEVSVGVAVPAVPHADVKHGSDAAIARQCLDGKRPFYLFFNQDTKRYGTVCYVDDMWAIVIVDELGNEITAFVKNKMKSFDQVLTYMKNAGYGLVH